MLELIAHAQMPLINAHASVSIARLHPSENRVDSNQLISLCENMFAYACTRSIDIFL